MVRRRRCWGMGLRDRNEAAIETIPFHFLRMPKVVHIDYTRLLISQIGSLIGLCMNSTGYYIPVSKALGSAP